MTGFFEPISVSATHVYHSALELCPISSIVRKLYYDRCHGITRLPRVVIGTPHSWDPTISISSKDTYQFCTWSPCGRFVAAQTSKAVEIRNHLTFELIDIFQFTAKHPSTGPLTYAPDGRSLASGFSNSIVIWDIQTGGVSKVIKCPAQILSLVWSMDGTTIATTLVSGRRTWKMRTYDVASGAQLFAEEFGGAGNFLWASKESFLFMTMESSNANGPTLKIFTSEIGPTLIKTESLSIPLDVEFPSLSTFSPSSRRVSILGPWAFHILDIQNSSSLLKVTDLSEFTSSQFSSDGSVFAASHWKGVRVWKFTSGGYTLWGEFPLQDLPDWSREEHSLRFSPTSSSILYQRGNALHLRRLHDLPITPKPCQFAAISCSGDHIATAHESKSTITIIDLRSQAPPQCINVGVEIEGLAMIGNVLLVAGLTKVVAWLRTVEGTMGGVFYSKMGDSSDRIWTREGSWHQDFDIRVDVEGQIVAIGPDSPPFVFHTETGNILESVDESQDNRYPQFNLHQKSDYREYYHLRVEHRAEMDSDGEVGWLLPHITTQEVGWVVDPDRRHRFWVPVEWRKSWHRENWHHDITTLFSNIGDQPVIIKF